MPALRVPRPRLAQSAARLTGPRRARAAVTWQWLALGGAAAASLAIPDLADLTRASVPEYTLTSHR